jgi:carboxyl-terminal processing protease
VASAIQDNQRGDIVGDKTFGEGSIQKLIEVPDGSALILSIAKYYTPNGKIIQDTGITPNVLVASSEDIATINDEDDNTTTEETPKAPKEDEQLRRAIEVLKNKQQKS